MGKPGPECTICSHREHAAIDLALVRGVSPTALSRRYAVGTDSLYRHRRNHLSPQLKAKLLAGPDVEIDVDRLRETESQSLLVNLVAVRHRLFASLDVAEESGDSGMASRVVGQVHRNLELTAKLLGELGVGSTNVTNILFSPVYVEMRVEMVRALAPFPDVREAVAVVLRRMETRAAEDVQASRELAR